MVGELGNRQPLDPSPPLFIEIKYFFFFYVRLLGCPVEARLVDIYRRRKKRQNIFDDSLRAVTARFCRCFLQVFYTTS